MLVSEISWPSDEDPDRASRIFIPGTAGLQHRVDPGTQRRLASTRKSAKHSTFEPLPDKWLSSHAFTRGRWCPRSEYPPGWNSCSAWTRPLVRITGTFATQRLAHATPWPQGSAEFRSCSFCDSTCCWNCKCISYWVYGCSCSHG